MDASRCCWARASRTSTLGKAASVVLAAGAAGLIAIAAQHLYLSRVSAVRAVEVIRLFRAAMLSGVVAYLVADEVGLPITIATTVVGTAIAFVVLAVLPFSLRRLAQGRPRGGRFGRPVVIIGSNDEGFELCRLLETHPEAGFRPVGVVGRQDQVQGVAGSLARPGRGRGRASSSWPVPTVWSSRRARSRPTS